MTEKDEQDRWLAERSMIQCARMRTQLTAPRCLENQASAREWKAKKTPRRIKTYNAMYEHGAHCYQACARCSLADPPIPWEPDAKLVHSLNHHVPSDLEVK